ncbi:MAG: S8 family serine peptidase [Bacteroidales bacterium]|nr:S8 family serine peptidase [Bacteroidales bacterium]MDY6001870.1 S8 family serine peptidase [Candidatus Cryptobacteroides sp.]
MKKFAYIFAAATLLTAASVACNNEEMANPQQSTQTATRSLGAARIPEGTAVPGKIVIKVNESTERNLILSQKGLVQMSSVPSPMSAALSSIKATEVERLFPIDERYEKRTRREGMHLWMVVTFDETVDVGTAMSMMKDADGVELVEYMPIAEMASAPQPFLKRESVLPFNDPLLINQWHYNNTGALPKSVEGADINLFKAWEISTGKPEVIVCVVDGGIDVTHPDLVDNLWVNEKEKNGTPGVDDDGNGFVDDVHGYCFVADTSDLKPDEDAHGTHVAGTVAAKNNNGIGVCGVAGGNESANSGARLMSAAIFREGYMSGGNTAAAIKYGADNGAVISQNSWGYPYKTGVFTLPSHLRKAIDYFVKYAGCDNDGNQLPDSPMKGGVVIFAAGNDNYEFTAQPSSYENVISVASIGPNFKKASYSTYGTWVDITAPGGEQFGNPITYGVLSTVSPNAGNTFGKSYEYYQGTSMACPHVSGVAALVVSTFGGKGYTNEMLKKQLLSSILPVDIDEENPGYIGKMGAGCIDAYAAVHNINREIAPQKPVFKEDPMSQNDFTSINLCWKVPADEDDGQASYFKLYYSENELNAANYSKTGKFAGKVKALNSQAGDEIHRTVGNLLPGTTYYFALEALDRWGLVSEPVFFSAATKVNNPAQIENVPQKPVLVLNTEKGEYSLKVSEPDGHSWKYNISGATKGVSHKRVDNDILITIRPVLTEGEYVLTIQLVDELGAESSYNIPFVIVNVAAPKVLDPFAPVTLGVKNGEASIKVDSHFTTNPYLSMSYNATSTDGTIASVVIDNGGILTVQPHKPGRTYVNVEASNGYKSISTSFEVQVTEDKDMPVYSVWPLPVRKEMNAWLNPSVTKATIIVSTMTGEEVFRKDVTANAQGIATVNLSDLAAGSYRLTITTNGETYRKTIVKY